METIGPWAIVASVTLGAARQFRMKPVAQIATEREGGGMGVGGWGMGDGDGGDGDGGWGLGWGRIEIEKLGEHLKV